MMIHKAPAHASQLIRASVWILEKVNAIMAATATKIAVHAPWSDSALNEIEMLRRAEPPLNIQSDNMFKLVLTLASILPR